MLLKRRKRTNCFCSTIDTPGMEEGNIYFPVSAFMQGINKDGIRRIRITIGNECS